jgi:hypothetical protein
MCTSACSVSYNCKLALARIVNYDSFPVNYDRNKFIVDATGVDLKQKRLSTQNVFVLIRAYTTFYNYNLPLFVTS